MGGRRARSCGDPEVDGMSVGTKNVGILLFPDVEELDAVGPWEVLSYWTHTFPQDGFAVVCLSQWGEPIRCAHGLTVHPQFSYADAPPLHVLLYRGGIGTLSQLTDEAQLAWCASSGGTCRCWPACAPVRWS